MSNPFETARPYLCGKRADKAGLFRCKAMARNYFFKNILQNDFVVENVIPYYKPLIAPDFKIQRHLFWSNKFILSTNFEKDNIDRGNMEIWQNNVGFDLGSYRFSRKNGLRKEQILKKLCKTRAWTIYF